MSMSDQTFNLQSRISALNAVLTKKPNQTAVESALTDAKGDWSIALATLKNKLPPEALQKVVLAHSLAELSNDNVPLVKALADQANVNNLRDVALQFNREGLAKLVDRNAIPEGIAGATPKEKANNFAINIRQKLFRVEPTAVLQRMVADAEVPITDKAQRDNIVTFLNNQPAFNIRSESIYKALKQPEAFSKIPEEQHSTVVEHMKTLQRVQALAPVPEAVPVLMKANLTSAFRIGEMPESTFLRNFGDTLGEETARRVYTNAINTRIRNEHALVTMRQAIKGTGLAIIDGQRPMEPRVAPGPGGPAGKEEAAPSKHNVEPLSDIDQHPVLQLRMNIMQQVADEKEVPINLETLFGGMDYCECDECLSVYSPASYFVELLQYLRNNNLDPSNKNTGQKGIANTPLEKLFRRRPDLGCLELTCQNTFTVFPYIDLVNEVMESFIVHLSEYQKDTNDPKQATLEAFNVMDETSSELLAQPQHINYEAYCILKNAVYPFTLPYHQPIDAIRIFLNYLGTSRYELLDTYRTAHECLSSSEPVPVTMAEYGCGDSGSGTSVQGEIEALHQIILDRSVDAEFLGLTQEEYIILTKEAFWPKRYFDITLDSPPSNEVYRQKIGVKNVAEYYGYGIETDAESNMLSLDAVKKTGLTFVKKQFLPRTGIQYTALVDLLKTQFINPDYPQGKALTILESLRFSYRFLQTLVDTSSIDPKVRFAKLIEFLQNAEPLIPILDALLHPDPCKKLPNHCPVISNTELRNWVYCYFEKIGQLIVLESGEAPELIVIPVVIPVVIELNVSPSSAIPLEGGVFKDDSTRIGTIRKDGTILDDITNAAIGHVTINLQVMGVDGKPFIEKFGGKPLSISLIGQGLLITIDEKGLSSASATIRWRQTQESCNLDQVRLTHLDGSSVTPTEYDRMQRFVRLWHKLDWTIDETDKALVGLAISLATGTANGYGNGNTPETSSDCQYMGFDAFKDDCPPVRSQGDDCCDVEPPCPPDDWNCPDVPQVTCEITVEFLHQLVAVRKLLDLTGVPLLKLLALWTEISTIGEKSLYSRLFLTHNLLGIDKVFKADANGNYLTQPAKITEHIPVLMAALNLKADDITEIMRFRQIPDVLILANVSQLYRHSLIAKILHVRVADLSEVMGLFAPLIGDPFKSAWNTKVLLEIWGKMEDAGFTFRQLNYIIRDHDDALHPLAPSQKTILQLTKTLYDGLNAIDRDNPDVKEDKKEEATTDLVRNKTGLLFDQSTVEKIIGLLEGAAVYTTNAPANLTIIIPDTLVAKIKYSSQKDAIPPTASIQVTGILTEGEKTQAKALSSDSGWVKAIDRASKQALNIFNDVLFGIFSQNKDDAIKHLLAGDVNIPPDPNNPAATDGNTAPVKRFYFLQYFLPFLRQRLAHRFIVDTLAGMASLANDVTDVLLTDILMVGTPAQSAISVLEKIHEKPAGTDGGWKGYLIPGADAEYTFVAIADTQPSGILLDGQTIEFPLQQEDPSNVWSSNTPVKLKSGKLYWLEVAGQSIQQLQWKTPTSPKAVIPTSTLLPDYSSKGTEEAFTHLFKVAILINGFNLGLEEISYFQSHGPDFAAESKDFNFNLINLGHWLRLQAYTNLRNNLPRGETTLLDLFKWAGKPGDPTKLSYKIAASTTWKKERIDQLIAVLHFDLNHPAAFRNEINLVKLSKALAVADKIGIDIDRLFDWAKPGSKFWESHEIAENIRKVIRARFDQDDWEQVVKPLNDQLRENQKQALTSYLLVQQDLIKWGVVDADSLFEFFLIDVQMDACMETSRIKQAISSLQLFVQRCFLGLEDKQDQNGKQIGVPNDALDRDRWEWLQRYRVWEANRKVFLYPENWIEPQLRDDKSPFYKELESELLQKDINTQTVEDALKSYLFKVDEVANLKVVGLYLEQDVDKAGTPVLDNLGNPVYLNLHIFSRTRNAPYFFYYRYFDTQKKNWYPWEKMQVDIPSYDVEVADTNVVTNGLVTGNGTYLIPIVWNGRLLVFFPQFAKKTLGAALPENIDPNATVPINKPVSYWEIKMSWSEYRNAKWTQKQISTDSVYETTSTTQFTPPNPLPNINSYEFIPRIDTTMTSGPRVVIDIHRNTTLPDAFQFAGSQISKTAKLGDANIVTDFHYDPSKKIHSLQAQNALDPNLLVEPSFGDETNGVFVKVAQYPAELKFFHPFVHELFGKLTTGSLDDLFDYYLERVLIPSAVPPALNDNLMAETYGDNGPKLYHELKGSYSLYNWEPGFHVPMLLADRLLNAQQFEQALKMCHHVFNPLAKGIDDKRFWQFPPFREVDAVNVLQALFEGLQPNQSNDQINEWRGNPFQPHVIARSRPSAYMKWVVMKYIEILIAWGDYLFRQDTIETLNQATQLYILATHIYGPHGQKIPKRGTVKPRTYNALLDKWDAFGNAMVELELVFPFSNQTPLPMGASNGVVGLANIFGFATTLYFCIPDNPQMRALRDTIDDRLFKIRHCQNIQGIFRQLPLFEPPIDPGLLVQAAAQGLSLASVLNDLNSPMPNYRFYYLLQKAQELCAEVKALGNAFLSAKEKGDAEAISKLRAKHESSIQNLVMEIKKKQLDEANQSLDALQQSRKGPVYRLQHQLKLIGEDLGKVPDVTTDFSELADQIEAPIDDSGLKLISFEKEEMDQASAAADWQIGIGALETLASIFHALPTIHTDVHPLGVGADVVWGFPNLGNATQGTARALRIHADDLSYQSSSAARKGGFLRQLQDRVLQANAAGYEIKNIDKQVLTQQIRISMASQEINNQQKQIDNAQEVEEFLRNKYTNEELYSWMESQIKTLYYQAYTLAYDLANRAEKVFRFERGLATSNFIQFGYWDAGYDGLLAGERMYVGLKQLEAAYQEKRGYDFEISMAVSLRQLNPLALLQLKETGTCEFILPEVLFDMNYPGHYMRRIKSVALTVPCVVGPYTSLNCTLRLLEHKFRTSSIAKDKSDYVEKTDATDERFSTVNVPIASIAASTGQTDSGVFELNFRDERYLPFEGAGAISKWRINLPEKFRQFDYDTISDVVMHLRYTAVDGGDKLKKPAADSVQGYIKSVEDLSREEGLFAAFDLRHDFPNEWAKATQLPAGATERLLMLNNLNERLPIFTKGRKPEKIQATDVYLFAPSDLSVSLLQGTTEVGSFGGGVPVGETMKSFSIKEISNCLVTNWQLKMSDTNTEIDKLWLVVRYVLT
jgi:hypothetical protein